MRALVVVHAENCIVDPDQMGKRECRRYRRLLDRIAGEVATFHSAGDRTYFIGDQSESPDSHHIYPAFTEHFPRMVYIEGGSGVGVFRQALQVKESMMKEKYERIDIAGVSYDLCVASLYCILTGKEIEGFLSKDELRTISENIGWSGKKFRDVFGRGMNAFIREELTDKRYYPIEYDFLV